jgi:hypothetical protein
LSGTPQRQHHHGLLQFRLGDEAGGATSATAQPFVNPDGSLGGVMMTNFGSG